MRFVALALALTLVGACASPGVPKANVPADRASEELDILETVVRYQCKHGGDLYNRRPECFFLSLAEAKERPKDPPAALLARFERQTPPVEPVHAADLEMWFGVHAKGKHCKGVLLCLPNIRWIDDDTVEVDGTYNVSSRGGTGNTYRAERRAGAWIVVSDTLLWIT